jgi:hypothetical protein
LIDRKGNELFFQQNPPSNLIFLYVVGKIADVFHNDFLVASSLFCCCFFRWIFAQRLWPQGRPLGPERAAAAAEPDPGCG